MSDSELTQPTGSVVAVRRFGEWFWRLRGDGKVTESSVSYNTEREAITAGTELGMNLGILSQSDLAHSQKGQERGPDNTQD